MAQNEQQQCFQLGGVHNWHFDYFYTRRQYIGEERSEKG
jgi:hypothetical protein